MATSDDQYDLLLTAAFLSSEVLAVELANSDAAVVAKVQSEGYAFPDPYLLGAGTARIQALRAIRGSATQVAQFMTASLYDDPGPHRDLLNAMIAAV